MQDTFLATYAVIIIFLYFPVTSRLKITSPRDANIPHRRPMGHFPVYLNVQKLDKHINLGLGLGSA